jgi:hypothetical protein
MRRHMLRELPVDRTATLRDLPFRALHTVYATWRVRVPHATPRTVHFSRELLATADGFTDADGLATTVREIAEGRDLSPRMSTAIEHAYRLEPPPLLARNTSRGRQYDGLLADWGIHHVHLGVAPHPRQRQFVGRTGYVLFAVFGPADAYVVDLQRHESDGANWSALSILEIIVSNWPDAGIVVPAHTDMRLQHGNWSDEERQQLRVAGIAGGAVEIDGQVWMAGGGGQSLAGSPMAVGQHSMAISWLLAGYDPTERDLGEQLRGMAFKHDVSDGPWQPVVDCENFGFFCDGLFVEYGSLLP